jgi:putative restriction endonuclease
MRLVRGFVAVTDPGWYERLARTPAPKDANFWRPSVVPVKLPIGTPFFFKLKAPHRSIAGVGFFAGFSVLPDWLAWETFGEANGVESLDELRARLAGIQSRASIAADAQGRIGCSLIAEAQFFPPAAWVAPPPTGARARSPALATISRQARDAASGANASGGCGCTRPTSPTRSRSGVNQRGVTQS